MILHDNIATPAKRIWIYQHPSCKPGTWFKTVVICELDKCPAPRNWLVDRHDEGTYVYAMFDEDIDLEVSKRVDENERNDIVRWALDEGYRRVNDSWGTHYGVLLF